MTTLNAEVIDAMMWRAGQTRNWAWDNKWPANVREFFDGDVPAIFAEITRLQAEAAERDPAKVAAWIAERDELAGQVATFEQENDRLRKRLESAQREADTWWKRSETQVDIIADLEHKIEAHRAALAEAHQGIVRTSEDLTNLLRIVREGGGERLVSEWLGAHPDPWSCTVEDVVLDGHVHDGSCQPATSGRRHIAGRTS